MAKLTLTIEAEDARDLMEALSDLASVPPADFTAHGPDASYSTADRGALLGEEEEPKSVGIFGDVGAPAPKATRKRRTTAEIAADEAAAAAAKAGPTAMGGVPHVETGRVMPASATGIFGDTAAETPSPSGSSQQSAGGATKEKMMTLIQQHLAKGSPAKTQEIVKAHANGAARMSEIPEEFWGAVSSAIQADL